MEGKDPADIPTEELKDSEYKNLRLILDSIDQLQKEIALLKANDEESLELTMQQNERFMDELAQKDTVIDSLNTLISEYRECSLRDRDATPEDLRDYQQHLSDTIEETEDKYERKIQCSDIALNILRDENECNKKNLRKMMQENRELKAEIYRMKGSPELSPEELIG